MSTVEQPGTELWLLWKRAHEHVRSAVINDVITKATVSEAELTVLVALSEAGGKLRQNALVVSTGWDRTRLSHLLTRMETRGYVSRHKLRNGVELVLEAPGRMTVEQSHPQLERGVRDHLLSKLDQSEQKALRQLLHKLIDEPPAATSASRDPRLGSGPTAD